VESLSDFLRDDAGYVSTLALVFAVFIPLERLTTRDPRPPPLGAYAKTFVFWLAYIPSVMVTNQLFGLVWRPLGVRPLLPSLAPAGWPAPLAAVAGALAAALVGDFFYYWCHRAQHRFFWRFHAVHHSVRRMHGPGAYHHVSEAAFKLVLYSVPLAFFTQDAFSLPVLGGILAWEGYYLHSPTRLHFGPLGRVLIDNRFHRIHHSLDPRHFDKNFGVFTTLWDSLFGTAWFPSADEWPDTGVADYPEPAGLGAYLAAPFLYRASSKPADRSLSDEPASL
jgi:sterol desaturase/sphingolipid hydroxylase (fatty acid hydroxylase superfamily)